MDRRVPISCLCSTWPEIRDCLDAFEAPATLNSNGEVAEEAWVFRGIGCSTYKLEPAIEREAKFRLDWPALELKVKSEFMARVRNHLGAASIPLEQDEFTWFALMQHYGVPTRLLDFTYSPFVALYFAIRSGHERIKGSLVRVEAIDAKVVNREFKTVARNLAKDEEPGPDVKVRYKPSITDPDQLPTQRDNIERDAQELQELIDKSLASNVKDREKLNKRGCVCVAPPSVFNPRLVNQQGVFLVNFARGLSLEESLTMMMEEKQPKEKPRFRIPASRWRKQFDIPVRSIPDIEKRLFQMNIHEQSLFPDLEGLTGLIRQKIRLHWK